MFAAVYLVLFVLAITPGVGITGRVVACGDRLCAVFDFNPFLWLPIVLIGAPLPSPWWAAVLWWLLFAAGAARAVTLLVRPLLGAPARAARKRRTAPRPTRRPA